MKTVSHSLWSFARAMNRRCTAVLGLLLLTAWHGTARGASYNLKGEDVAGFGVTRNWTDPNAWEPSGVPAAGDDITLGTGAFVDVPNGLTTLGNVALADRAGLRTANPLTVSNLSFSNNNLFTIFGELTINGSLSSPYPITFPYPVHMTNSSRLGGAADVTFTGSGTGSNHTAVKIDSDLSFARLKLTYVDMTGSGSLTITGPSTWSDVNMSNAVVVKSALSGTFTLLGYMLISSNNGAVTGQVGLTGRIDNNGKFDGTIGDNGAGTRIFSNQQGGTFLDRASNTTGSLLNAAGAIYRTSNDTVQWGGLQNSGLMDVQSSLVKLVGPVTNNGVISNVAGPGAQDQPGEVDFIGPTVLNTGTQLKGDGRYEAYGPAHVTLNANVTVPCFGLGNAVFYQGNGTASNAVPVLDGSGDMDIAKKFVWSAGTVAGTTKTVNGLKFPGLLTIGSEAIAEIRDLGVTPPVPKTLRIRRFVNNGTLKWYAGQVTLDQAGEIRNLGTLVVQPHGGAVIRKTGSADAYFTNLGVVRVSPGSAMDCGGKLLNGGALIALAAGSLFFSGGGANYGNFRTVGSNALIEFTGGKCDLEAGTTIVGPGRCRLNGATLNIIAPITVQKFEMASGILTGSGNFDVNGTDGKMRWSGGVMSGTGLTTIAPGCSLSIEGVAHKALFGRRLNNNGTTTWTGPGNLLVNAPGVFNNNSVFKIENDSTLGHLDAGVHPLVTNKGRLIKTIDPDGRNSEGTGTTRFDGAFTNLGEVSAAYGELLFTHGYNQTGGNTDVNSKLTVGGGPLTIGDGSSLSGNGTVTGDVMMSGSVAPNVINSAVNSLQINGNYTQTATGQLNVQIGKSAQGRVFITQLQVSKKATLGGAVNIALASGFDPRPALGFTQYFVMFYGSHSGSFATLTGSSEFFTAQYFAASAALVAAAAPHSVASRPNPAMLSTARISLTGGTLAVQLVFAGNLDSVEAADPAHYTVEVQGTGATAQPVESASYNGATRTVTLYLPAASLHRGDRIVGHWHEVRDQRDHLLSGQTPSLAVP